MKQASDNKLFGDSKKVASFAAAFAVPYAPNPYIAFNDVTIKLGGPNGFETIPPTTPSDNNTYVRLPYALFPRDEDDTTRKAADDEYARYIKSFWWGNTAAYYAVYFALVRALCFETTGRFMVRRLRSLKILLLSKFSSTFFLL